MAPSRKTAVAAAFALMARGIAAIGPYYSSATTVSAEPQLVGSSTSADLVLYSFNYCTVVQSTTCQVTVSTGSVATATPEYTTYSIVKGDTTAVITVPVSSTSSSSSSSPPTTWAGESATSTAAGVDAPVSQTTITVDLGQPSETASPITDGPSSSSAEVVTAVISTTDDAGNPTLITSTSAAGMAWTASSSDSAIVSEMTSSSASSSSASFSSSSSTAMAGYNSTMASTHQPSSATAGSTSAPKKSGAGASYHAIPATAIVATVVATLFLF